MGRRSSKIILTKEGQVLKQLRSKAGLSMKEAGAQAGVSDSMISFLENGRVAIPKTETLANLLKAYGTSRKSFYYLVSTFNEDADDIQFLTKVLPRLSQSDLQFVRQVVEMRLQGVK